MGQASGLPLPPMSTLRLSKVPSPVSTARTAHVEPKRTECASAPFALGDAVSTAGTHRWYRASNSSWVREVKPPLRFLVEILSLSASLCLRVTDACGDHAYVGASAVPPLNSDSFRIMSCFWRSSGSA